MKLEKGTGNEGPCRMIEGAEPGKQMSEMTSELNPERAECGHLGRLRAAALIAVVIGAAGSFGLLLRAGQHTPRFLLVLMAGWVLSPFIGLVLANVVSKRWSSLTRATLYGVMLAVTLSSLVFYVDDAMGHRRPQAAFVFVLVPPVSWALSAIAVAVAALISGKRSRRRDGETPGV